MGLHNILNLLSQQKLFIWSFKFNNKLNKIKCSFSTNYHFWFFKDNNFPPVLRSETRRINITSGGILVVASRRQIKPHTEGNRAGYSLGVHQPIEFLNWVSEPFLCVLTDDMGFQCECVLRLGRWRFSISVVPRPHRA